MSAISATTFIAWNLPWRPSPRALGNASGALCVSPVGLLPLALAVTGRITIPNVAHATALCSVHSVYVAMRRMSLSFSVAIVTGLYPYLPLLSPSCYLSNYLVSSLAVGCMPPVITYATRTMLNGQLTLATTVLSVDPSQETWAHVSISMSAMFLIYSATVSWCLDSSLQCLPCHHLRHPHLPLLWCQSFLHPFPQPCCCPKVKGIQFLDQFLLPDVTVLT